MAAGRAGRTGRASLVGLREPVADAIDRLEVAGRRRQGLDLPADVLHVRVDGALVRLERDAADRLEQLGAREDAAGLGGKRGEELELRRRELDGPAGDGRLEAWHVEDEVAGGYEFGLRGRPLGAPEHRTDPGDELLRAEGLGEVVVRAELQADELVGLLAAAREHDDGDRRLATDRAGDVEAIDLGKPEIEHHEIGPRRAEDGERGPPVVRDLHAEARVLEVVARELDDLRLVVDDEDPLHGGHPTDGPARGRTKGRSPTTPPFALARARSATGRRSRRRGAAIRTP